MLTLIIILGVLVTFTVIITKGNCREDERSLAIMLTLFFGLLIAIPVAASIKISYVSDIHTYKFDNSSIRMSSIADKTFIIQYAENKELITTNVPSSNITLKTVVDSSDIKMTHTSYTKIKSFRNWFSLKGIKPDQWTIYVPKDFSIKIN